MWDKMEPKRKIKSFYKAFFYFSSFLILLSCQSIKEGRPYVGYGYGEPVNYGEGKHPGVDYYVTYGTPIIACADGFVYDRGNLYGRKGEYYISINHTGRKGLYAHLSRVYVRYGESLKRGQLIGLSGASGRTGIKKLHFGVGRSVSSNLRNFSNTFYPHKLGRNGGLPECFDPNKDYSDYGLFEITLPIPCRDYNKILKREIKNRKIPN